MDKDYYYDVEIESYYATILLSGIVLDTNNYTLNITIDGNNNYNKNYGEANLTVNKANITTIGV